jgi:CubicO group peptidase (beta-lactamase class C family)
MIDGLELICTALKAIRQRNFRSEGMDGAMSGGTAATNGFAAGKLAAIDRHIAARYLDTGRLPHAQLLVAKDGEIAHFSHQGAARDGAPAPIDERSLFRIASMTKPITSVAFMMLVEEAKVALDTPVADVLPELAGVGVYAGGGGDVPFATRALAEPIRMVDLLRHTAGFTYSFQNRSNIDAAYRAGKIESWHGAHDLQGFVAALGELPIEFAPGTGWNYSVATDVLGAVVERVSGQTLDEFFASRIFAPLGMADTFFHVPADKIERLVDCYALTPAGRVLYDRGAASAWSRAPKLLSGGGGLVSTALDYHRFCSFLLNGGVGEHGGLLGRKTIELMTRNHLPGGADLASLSRSMFSETTNAGAGFGLGFAVTIDPARAMLPGSVGEYYWGGMFSTAFFIDPVERIHMVFMTQLSPSSAYPIRREIKTMIYAALT